MIATPGDFTGSFVVLGDLAKAPYPGSNILPHLPSPMAEGKGNLQPPV